LASFAVDITAVIETWYRNKETGQIFSLHPLINRPGLWMDVDPNDLIEPGQRVPVPYRRNMPFNIGPSPS